MKLIYRIVVFVIVLSTGSIAEESSHVTTEPVTSSSAVSTLEPEASHDDPLEEL